MNFSPIIYDNAIADKMGVSTAFVLKSGCTQRERRGGNRADIRPGREGGGGESGQHSATDALR